MSFYKRKLHRLVMFFQNRLVLVYTIQKEQFFKCLIFHLYVNFLFNGSRKFVNF